MREWHDTVVIGGGQAGLAMSYHLRERGREHVVLERKRVAERWHTERWNSLRYQFPNWFLRLPGFTYKGDDPDGFAHHSEVTKFVEDYARFIDAPVRCGAEVVSLREEPDSGGFLIDTNDSVIAASRVVVATGPFQRPSVPACSTAFPPHVFQVHASRYLSPDQLPPGAVLVVGSGASGCQIAEELYQCGRTVYLSVSRHRRIPRRYRGRDVIWWFIAMGRMDTTIDSFPGRKMPPSTVVTGVNGGHDVDVRQFAADGVVVLGRLNGVAEGKLSLADNAEEILAEADKAYVDFERAADDYARTANVDVPGKEKTNSVPDSASIQPASTVDLKAANITSVVWGTGYEFDYGWLKVPVLNERGAPMQERGVTNRANLYFLGLHWMHTFKSGVLFGVGDDAAYLADHITARA
jgi:putative flavoprotein involved in K+ transport